MMVIKTDFYPQKKEIIFRKKVKNNMYILLWILFGAIVGWIASILTHNNNRMGLIANIIVGLVGSAIGGLLASLLKLGSLNDFSFWGFAFAILGAVILLSVINLFRSNHHR